MTPLRGIAFLVGLVLLGATAHATIGAAGGYGSAHSYVTLAIAAGVAVGALVLGPAWGERRALARWLVAAILAGEAFGFLSTADRLIVAREDVQAPLKDAGDARAKAANRVAAAAAAVAALPATSPRLEAAIAAKAAADREATARSSERGCRDNCRQLLQAQVDSADREIAAARAELDTKAAATKSDFDRSRAALAAMKAPASATPFADRVGVSAWVIDLALAGLGSMACNGLAIGLISFAGHRRREEVMAPRVEAPRPAPQSPVERAPDEDAESALLRFAVEHILPDKGGRTADVLAIGDAYERWCAERRLPALTGAELGQALAGLFKSAKIPVRERNGEWVAVGVRLEQPQRQLQLAAN